MLNTIRTMMDTITTLWQQSDNYGNTTVVHEAIATSKPLLRVTANTDLFGCVEGDDYMAVELDDTVLRVQKEAMVVSIAKVYFVNIQEL